MKKHSMFQPLISIIVPCYNQAQYLDECLQSVMDQTYQTWECIIVNDGSPDNTEEIVKYWLDKDNRFRYIFQENKGVSAARNNGIKNAKGEWILPLDGDDKVHQDYLKYANEKIREDYDIIYSNAQYFGEKNDIWKLDEFSFVTLLYHNIIFCSAIFRKKQNVLFDETMVDGLEDWEFWISYISQDLSDIKIYKFDKILFYYRIKKESKNQKINFESSTFNNVQSYVLSKHYATYKRYIGDYFDLLYKTRLLEKEKNIYKKAYESKRYKLGDKIVTMLEKLKIK
ncbi:glycosyltransferase family 2 protein [Chryseobacterium mulctrae]|uniref:glycosyltransferase family 2 protein n=1 Tax=Chryseobacterium mulctrae TaxID=2576777 RepID=UPI001115AF5F|nr:glycosyltransferase family 2 protein [Chryseobacterium mulctrae]